MANQTGGCMCGKVRYELRTDPNDCGWCHCRTYQLFGGAPATRGLEGTEPPDDSSLSGGR